MNPQRNRILMSFVAAAVLLAVGGLALISRRHDATKIPVPEISRRDLVLRDGRWYRNSQTNPAAGWMVDSYPNGTPLLRAAISNGLLEGLSESWYTNGQIQVREHFKAGVSDGLREKWYENGRKMSQALIVAGKITGPFQRWHDNGQLAEQIQMNHGQPDGIAWAYYPSGFIKAQTKVRDGQVLNRKSWKDGERKSIQ